MKKYIALGSLMAFTPLLTFAATFESILLVIKNLMGVILPIMISLAVIFFIYSLLSYILKEGDEKAAAKTQMIWGIVILFAIVAVWGLVDVLLETFDIDTGAIPDTSQLIPTS